MDKYAEQLEAEVEADVLNVYGTIFLRWPQLEFLLDKLRHNTVLGSPKPIRSVAFQMPALVMCDTESDTLSRRCDSIISYTSPVGESPVLSGEWNDERLVGLPPVALTLDWAAKHAVEELEVPQYQQQDRKPEDRCEIQRQRRYDRFPD